MTTFWRSKTEDLKHWITHHVARGHGPGLQTAGAATAGAGAGPAAAAARAGAPRRGSAGRRTHRHLGVADCRGFRDAPGPHGSPSAVEHIVGTCERAVLVVVG